MGRPLHGYRNAAGEKIPGTTTIISRWKDSGGLLQWAYKQGREHESLALRGLPGPTHLYDARDAAGAAGNLAHDMIEADILGRDFKPPDVSADLLTKALNAFAQFREWREQTRIEIVATERAYVSEKHQFGGTVDAVGIDARKSIVLIDYKTSNSVYTDYLVQLAAYALLLEECAPDWTPKGFHLLRISKESADFAHYYFGELESAKEQFLLLRRAYDLDFLLKKRVA